MKKTIAIIDYNLSNLFSVHHACEFVGFKPVITSDADKIMMADGAILPGVGAFADAMNNLKKLNLIKIINKYVDSGKPFFGICLGFQLLFSSSEEFGLHKGLDIIKGKVVKFPKTNKGNKIRVPQIGWNKIYKKSRDDNWSNSPFKSIKNNDFMYFVHSYFAQPQDKKNILSLTDYEGIEYCSSILYKNVFATQFHPEKSAVKGLSIYKNFVR